MKKIYLFVLGLIWTIMASAQQTVFDTIDVDGTKFTITPGHIYDTIHEGQEGKTFEFQIVPLTNDIMHEYGFDTQDLIGMPNYAISTEISCCGFRGINSITGTFSGREFKLKNPKKGQIFEVTIAVLIYHGSAVVKKFLYLPVTLTVTPAIAKK